MTMTMPPNTPGSRRAVPDHMDADEIERLRSLLHQREHWVLRPDWHAYLEGEDRQGVAIAGIGRDHRIAARSWLAQQRHRLYRALEGEAHAPDGWLEELPLYQALGDDATG